MQKWLETVQVSDGEPSNNAEKSEQPSVDERSRTVPALEEDETVEERRSTEDAVSILTHATIAAEEVRDRVKRQLKQKQRVDASKAKVRAKGAADALRRSRNYNKSVAREYAGWDDGDW